MDETGADATWNTTTAASGSSQSLRLNGTNNNVVVPFNAKLKPSSVNKLSVSLWMKTTDNNAYMLVSEDADGTAGWVYTAVGQPSAGEDKPAAVFFYSGSNAGWRLGNVAANDGQWHHIVAVYDESATNTVSLYQDGVLVGWSSLETGGWSSASDNDVTIQIGSRENEGQWYQYYLDELAYFTDIGLTAAQVTDLYNNGWPPDSYAGIRRG